MPFKRYLSTHKLFFLFDRRCKICLSNLLDAEIEISMDFDGEISECSGVRAGFVTLI